MSFRLPFDLAFRDPINHLQNSEGQAPVATLASHHNILIHKNTSYHPASVGLRSYNPPASLCLGFPAGSPPRPPFSLLPSIFPSTHCAAGLGVKWRWGQIAPAPWYQQHGAAGTVQQTQWGRQAAGSLSGAAGTLRHCSWRQE